EKQIDGYFSTYSKRLQGGDVTAFAELQDGASGGQPAVGMYQAWIVERRVDLRGLGDNGQGLGVPGRPSKAPFVRDFDVEIAQAAVIADPIVGQDDADSRSVESYSAFKENPFVRAVGDDARSTFALDVDTASYSNVRRFLRSG